MAKSTKTNPQSEDAAVLVAFIKKQFKDNKLTDLIIPAVEAMAKTNNYPMFRDLAALLTKTENLLMIKDPWPVVNAQSDISAILKAMLFYIRVELAKRITHESYHHTCAILEKGYPYYMFQLTEQFNEAEKRALFSEAQQPIKTKQQSGVRQYASS